MTDVCAPLEEPRNDMSAVVFEREIGSDKDAEPEKLPFASVVNVPSVVLA